MDLINSTVSDFLFVNLLVNPFFVITWRGTWTNADYVFDVLVFKGDLYRSTLASFVTGILGSAVIMWTQHGIRKFARKGGKCVWIYIYRSFKCNNIYTCLLYTSDAADE